MEQKSESKPGLCTAMAVSRPTRKRAKEDAEEDGRRSQSFAVTMLSMCEVRRMRAISPRRMIRRDA
jgi:hypothetical protein